MRALFVFSMIFLTPTMLAAEVALDPLFQGEMVLQRDAEIPVWGTADPDASVKVTLGERTAKVIADHAGKWNVRLSPQGATPSAELSVVAGDSPALKRRVLLGDVWICAGQSNMDFPLRSATGGEQAAAEDKGANVRYLVVPDREAAEPLKTVDSRWMTGEKEVLLSFSAIGFWFGKTVSESEHVPLGLIRCSKGATPIARWMKSGDLFNGMVSPIAQLPARGVIWYQGESDADHPREYAANLSQMIGGWRNQWNLETLRFIIVQLPGYGPLEAQPVAKSGWAEVRQAQAKVASEVKNVWLATTIDCGSETEIHPPDKAPLAKRVAAVALKHLYQRDVMAAGPCLQKVTRTADGITLTFSERLKVCGDPSASFTICYDDGSVVRPRVTARDNVLHITGNSAPNAKSIRYAWANNPQCTLFNEAGWPVAPFEVAIPETSK